MEIETVQAPVSRRRIPSWLLHVVLYSLSAASLIWVFHDVDLRQVWNDLLSLEWRYVSLAIAFDLGVYLCHAWRWNLLLLPVARCSYWRSVQAIYFGLFINEVLPLRTGEIVRCYLVAFWNDLAPSVVFSSAVIERVLDGLWLVIAFLITSARMPLPRRLTEGVRVLEFFVVIAFALLAYLAINKRHARALVKGRTGRWATMLRHIIDGLHLMGNWRTLCATTTVSLIYMVLQIIPVWALLYAYGLDLSFWDATAVLIIVRLGTVVPNAPGNVGLYQASCIVALRMFGVDKTTAVSFSLMMWFVLTAPLAMGGSIAMALTDLKLSHIRHQARRGFEAHSFPIAEG